MSVGQVRPSRPGGGVGLVGAGVGGHRRGFEGDQQSAAVGKGRFGLGSTWRGEVVTGFDGGEPALESGQVGFGFFDLGVGGVVAVDLVVDLVHELGAAFDDFAVLAVTVGLLLGGDLGFFVGVDESGADDPGPTPAVSDAAGEVLDGRGDSGVGGKQAH